MQRNHNKISKTVFTLATSSFLVLTSLLTYNDSKVNAAIIDSNKNIATRLGRIFGNENESKQAGIIFRDDVMDVCQPLLPENDGIYLNKPLISVDDGIYINNPSRSVDDGIYLIPQCASHNIA